MSLENYEKAVQIIKNTNSKSSFIGVRTDELISKAEEVISLNFTGTYRDFLKNYGAGNFGSEEIYGIIDDDFEDSSVPDAIWYTLSERKEINMPRNLLVIYATGDGELYCLDFNRINGEKEPAVVSFFPGFDLNIQKYEIIAKDFGEFLLQRVTAELEME